MHDFLEWPGWLDLTVVAAGAGALLSLVFVIRYHYATNGGWRDTSEGQWMLYGRAIIAALLALAVIARLFPDWPGRKPVTFALMALYAAQTYWPLALVNHAHRGHRHRTEHEGAHRR